MSLAAPDRRHVETRRVFSVWELTAHVKDQLEGAFANVAVSGEISNYSRPTSGHSYFTLKDDRAQIRAVLWRSTAARLRFDVQDGLEVVCIGDLEVYPPRGTYQLVVRDMLPRGLGGLELALRQLRERLAVEGLFDPARKRPLPRLPRRIAVVTSPTGAALHDFLEALTRRWQGADVIVVPSRVQGPGAALEIFAALTAAQRLRPRPDVIVVTRGGGSLEDLWAFNEEPVVRAIAASAVPVVSAIGHEVDVTLADLAADVRALTPTDAATKVAPSLDELAGALAHLAHRIDAQVRRRLTLAQHRLAAVAARRLWQQPYELLAPLARRVDELEARLARAGSGRIEQGRQRLRELAARVEALSPLGVLARGYSLTLREDDQSLVTDARKVQPGERIVSRLASGALVSRVEQSFEKGSE